MELKVGGRFKLTKRLGKGAFGALYSAINIKSGEEVAVKLVSILSKISLKIIESHNFHV